MNFYAFSGLLTFITSLGFGIFSWVKGTKRLNKIWAIFCFCVAIWGLGCFKFSSVFNTDQVFFWLRIGHVGVILMPAFFLHFILEFLELRRLKTLLSIYAFGIFFSVINLTDALNYTNLLIAHLRFVFNEFYVDSPPAQLYPIFLCYYFGTILYAHYCAFKQYRNSSALKKNQMKYFLAATVLGFSGGATSFFMVFGIDIYPSLHVTVPLYPVIMTYAIVNYKLMDIEVVIKKTIVFAGIVGAAVSVIAFPFTLIQAVIGRALGVPDPFILMALGIATAVLIYRPVERVLVNITDKYLFQKKQEINVILNRLSERIVTILDLKQIGKTVLSTLEETFRLESGMIFFRDSKSEKYRLLEYFGLQPSEFANSVKHFFEQSDISSYLLNHKPILALDHFNLQRVPGETKNWLELAKARVCVPLMVDEDHKGLLVLGKKKSDQEFAQEEADYFPTIASQVSLAIQKALLVETVLEEREAKIKAEHVAERVRFARTIKHEQKNSLAGMESPARFLSMYHVPDLKKAFKENDEEWFMEICSKINKVSQDICKGVDKVLDIAEASLGGMETGEQPFRKISFKVIWEDAKESSGVKGCDYETTMPDGFAVCVRYAPFERVLENLVINADDAMKDQDQKLIQLNCSYREIDGKQVAYFEFKDNGPGIPKEIQDRIFQPGFSTKPKPDDANLLATGYGQGLYVCKNNIENIHHGKIWVESEPREGATFKFWIPIRENG